MAQTRSVTLRGVTARYTARERELMRRLPEPERLWIHLAKAHFNGRLK